MTKEFGTSDQDEGHAIVSLGSTEVLVAGSSYGAMVSPNLGSADAFFTPCCA